MQLNWPTHLLNNQTRAGTALINKVDEQFAITQDDINSLYDLTDPYRCPAEFIDYLGNDLHAEILPGDDIRTKRIKCANAITEAKNKSLWQYDLKLRIELVVGYTVDLYSRRTSETLEDSIFWGGSETRTRRWSVFGTTGSAGVEARGELFVGGLVDIPYVEDFIPGMVVIDVKSSKTAPELAEIVLAINRDGGYVGHRVFIGYLSGTVFTVEAEA